MTDSHEFWRAELDGAVLAVPFAPAPSAGAAAAEWGATEAVATRESTARLLAVLRTLDVSPFHAGLAAVSAVLEHHAHRPDVVVLTQPAGGDGALLPVRVQITGDPGFGELIAVVRAAASRAAEHGRTTLDAALESGGVALEPSASGGSAVAFECASDVRAGRADPAGVGCFVRLVADTDSLRVGIRFRAAQVGAACAERLAAQIADVLCAFGDDPSRPLSRIELTRPHERRAALAASRGPEGPPRPWPLVADAVEDAARRDPGAPAIVEEGRTIPYGTLLAAADELAARLAAIGVGPGDVVPVIGHRSAETVASWLGVLRCGAAYSPIDADLPATRLLALVEESNARAVVREPSVVADFAATVRLVGPADFGAPAAVRPRAAARGDLAYVIFTSGSTGRPKGVEIGQEALAHLLACRRRSLGLGPATRTTLVSGLGFDVAAAETWSALSAGASLHLPPAEARIDPARLRDWIVEKKLTLAFAPTIFAESLIRMDWPPDTALRILETAGEALRRRPVHGLPFEVVNLYGPTEFTVYATQAVVTPDGEGLPPIGLPLEDSSGYVTDHRGRVCADGVVGELRLAGPQLARGYRGLADATAAAFGELELEAGRRERMYRTGDLVRRGRGAMLEFLGRRDSQIKLRGARIEPGEIVACIETHPAVSRAVVVMEDASAPTARLIAYVVLRDAAAGVGAGELRDHASARLPRYMVPARVVVVPSVPLTPNGKLDVAALRRHSPVPAAPAVPEALTPTEAQVLAIWREMLASPSLGRDDDFFASGGHSLLAVRTLAVLERETGVRLPARVLLEASTARRLAEYVAAVRSASAPEFPSVVRIRDGIRGAPLFCLPGVGGHAFQYRELAARMHTPRAIFALQIHDLDAPTSTIESVGLTADAFVERMRSVQPRGPYALTGYSYGGVVAIEIARRLRALGETVAFVGLVDTYPPAAVVPSSRLRRVRQHLANLGAARSFGEAFDYLRQKARRRTGLFSFALRERMGRDANPSADLERRIEETSLRCVQAYDAYVPRMYAGRVTAFRAARLGDWDDVNDPTHTCGWGPLCDAVEVVDIDCEHSQFFKEPHISELARRLDESLSRLGDEG